MLTCPDMSHLCDILSFWQGHILKYVWEIRAYPALSNHNQFSLGLTSESDVQSTQNGQLQFAMNHGPTCVYHGRDGNLQYSSQVMDKRCSSLDRSTQRWCSLKIVPFLTR